jgi:choline dehydrogenase
VAVLPHDDDWSHIADLTSDSSWNPKSMRRIFERIERCNYLLEGTPGHRFAGWLETAHPDPILVEGNLPVVQAALSEVGSKHHRGSNVSTKGLIYDINSLHPHRKDGVYEVTLQMSKTGRRSSPPQLSRCDCHCKER